MNAPKPTEPTKVMKAPALDASKVWAFRLLALLIPTLLGFVVLVLLMLRFKFIVQDDEGNVTVQRPFYLQEPGFETTGHQYLYDPRLGWRNIPDYSAATFGRQLTINSKGLRDRDYPYDKPSGTRRILALGDSFTWGYGVEDSEIYTEVLERAYAEHQPPIEVLNAGVSGWGNDQQYLFLTDEGFKYQPDVVVVGFFLMNDPVENTSSRVYEMNKPVFLDTNLTLGNSPVLKPSYYPVDKTNIEPVTMTLAIMKGMARQCAEQNAALIIMKFGLFLDPTNETLLEDQQRISAEVAQWQGVHYLDLDSKFAERGHSKAKLTEGNHDGHWNAFGHQVTAEILADFLAATQLDSPERHDAP